MITISMLTVREHPHMTSAKISDFLTPSPPLSALVHIRLTPHPPPVCGCPLLTNLPLLIGKVQNKYLVKTAIATFHHFPLIDNNIHKHDSMKHNTINISSEERNFSNRIHKPRLGGQFLSGGNSAMDVRSCPPPPPSPSSAFICFLATPLPPSDADIISGCSLLSKC